MKNYVKGWYQVAFERDVPNGLSPASVGERRLMLVRSSERLRAFSADCPHRGAYLVGGGRLHEDSIICPFHGYRIGLGRVSKDQFSVHEYPVMAFGGMVFVQLSPNADDEGWSHYAKVLEEGNFLINGFEMKVRTRMETVIENAFDQRHFMAVHGVPTSDFTVRRGEYGELIVESLFYVPTRGPGSAGMEADPALLTPYRAIVISPGKAMVELQGALAYTVITGATDTADGECIVRLTLALPRSRFGTVPPPSVYAPLLEHSRRGLEQDKILWENLALSAVPAWTPADGAVREFIHFCQTFCHGR